MFGFYSQKWVLSCCAGLLRTFLWGAEAKLQWCGRCLCKWTVTPCDLRCVTPGAWHSQLSTAKSAFSSSNRRNHGLSLGHGMWMVWLWSALIEFVHAGGTSFLPSKEILYISICGAKLLFGAFSRYQAIKRWPCYTTGEYPSFSWKGKEKKRNKKLPILSLWEALVPLNAHTAKGDASCRNNEGDGWIAVLSVTTNSLCPWPF